MKTPTKEQKHIELVMNRYLGAYFDAIQEVLNKKQLSNDINLDIEMKIYSKVHQTLIQVKEELLK